MQRTKVLKEKQSRLSQGDILRNVHWIEHVVEGQGKIEVAKVVFPFTIVLTQDCDLEQDHRLRVAPKDTQDKYLISVLLAPLYNVVHVYQGEHLRELGIEMEPVPKKGNTGNFLRNNERPRYHYLEFDEDVQIVPSVIDFKHYFSATVTYLQEIKTGQAGYVCSVAPIFREDIAQRFASYLARVGLPDFEVTAEEDR